MSSFSRQKLISTILAFSIVPLLLTSGFSYSILQKSMIQNLALRVEAIATREKNHIEQILQLHKESIELIASRTAMRQNIQDFNQSQNPDSLTQITRILNDALKSSSSFVRLEIVNEEGSILTSTDPNRIGDREIQLERDLSITEEETGTPILQNITQLELNEEPIGYLVTSFKLDVLVKESQNYSGLGSTGEMVIVRRIENGAAQVISSIRFKEDVAFNAVIPSSNGNMPVQRALNQEEGVFHDGIIDHRGERVYASTRYIPELDWGLIVKIDEDEVYAPIHRAGYILLITLIGLVSISFASSRFLVEFLQGNTKKTQRK